MILKITAILLMTFGAAINYGAKFIVKCFSLEQKVRVKEADEFSDEDLEKYKRMKAMSIVKLTGFCVLLPGVVLVFLAFR